ncbi:hypothetical protein BpHYR1_017159 [Brachionus plicatilis]|uniref:Uncharacterized protein n=1 Tax=Brachionus plicatilis TaxID=10195 RepID=A0A3M7T695_BRAPC|nr:hypothetical protein BpHYR1_017159 [Brachionus plicatilis]
MYLIINSFPKKNVSLPTDYFFIDFIIKWSLAYFNIS